MRLAASVLCCVVLAAAQAYMPPGKEELQEAYTWKQIDFKFSDHYARQQAIESREFIPENNIPLGLEVWGSKIFVTLPRWKTGVPASLAYIDRGSDPIQSPLLKPYPDWEAHDQSSSNPRRIVSPFRVRVDSCNRLWILDSGKSDLLGNRTTLSFAQIVVYDLLSDQLIRNFTIPQGQIYDRSLFITLAVDVVDCARTWAYAADFAGPSLVVYDWEANTSWRVNDHEYFTYSRVAENYNVSGTSFTWRDGIFGLALSDMDRFTSERTLFFHPFSSFDEFSVSTHILRSEYLSKYPGNKYAFRQLGSRGFNTQSGPSYVSEKHGILFYTLVNMNAIGCWNYHHQTSYSPDTNDIVALDNVKLVFPNDIKVDDYDNLWLLSNRLQSFVFSSLDPKQVNFRIVVAPLQQLIKDTKCDFTFARGLWFE